MALEDSKSMLYQQYEMARAQLAEENLKIQQDAYAQTVGSHDRINQKQHHINTLEAQKNQLFEEKIPDASPYQPDAGAVCPEGRKTDGTASAAGFDRG
ncbi:hypothetical protein DQ04_07931030 [Trypanosoma grayi]|uniref:hypothetical protein n=1 Tax=Trypanosoma grayi TaxID=71804 RepID=UPI0004F4618C|nr:hypothetical protein DQ04_07931030 [Trypanosoma grayi]KEG08136.1 hypothetical protein DQ04_07931030 [Trypanosoma grayi]